MDLNKLALKNILSYNQDNPFDSGTQFDTWKSYNIIYQQELRNYFADKTQVEYNAYIDNLFKSKKQTGQLLFSFQS
jgi:hypothetical protein